MTYGESHAPSSIPLGVCDPESGLRRNASPRNLNPDGCLGVCPHAPNGGAVSRRENRTLSHSHHGAGADGHPKPNRYTGSNLYFNADQHATSHPYPHSDAGTNGYANPQLDPNANQHSLVGGSCRSAEHGHRVRGWL